MHTVLEDSETIFMTEMESNETAFIYPHSSGFAIASLILGIVSAALSCIPVMPVMCAFLGLLFAAKARKRERLFKNGIITAGLILSICGLVLSLMSLLYWIWYLWIFMQFACPMRERPEPMPRYEGMPASFCLLRSTWF